MTESPSARARMRRCSHARARPSGARRGCRARRACRRGESRRLPAVRVPRLRHHPVDRVALGERQVLGRVGHVGPLLAAHVPHCRPTVTGRPSTSRSIVPDRGGQVRPGTPGRGGPVRGTTTTARSVCTPAAGVAWEGQRPHRRGAGRGRWIALRPCRSHCARRFRFVKRASALTSRILRRHGGTHDANATRSPRQDAATWRQALATLGETQRPKAKQDAAAALGLSPQEFSRFAHDAQIRE